MVVGPTICCMVEIFKQISVSANMRVLHFYKTSFPDTMGGVEQVINQIAMGSSRQGIATDVLALSAAAIDGVLPLNGYHLHRTRLNFQLASTGFSFTAFSRFAELAQQADIIHYHFPWPFMDLVHFAMRPNKPCLVTYHSDIIRQQHLLKLYRPLQWQFLKSMDRIVATSPNYLATSPVLDKFKDKVCVIPIGMDKTAYPAVNPERLSYWQQRLGTKFFLFVGALRYYKGLNILLEAAQGTEFPIVIVGAGPIEQELKQQASRLNLNNIHFLGYLPDADKVALLSLCYAVVFPSHLRSEAFGVSLVESSMFAKPMISSEIGTGTTYVNIANQTGLVIPPSDPVALNQAMHYLWEHPQLAAQLGQQAEQRYWQYFSGERMITAYLALYRNLFANAGTADL